MAPIRDSLNAAIQELCLVTGAYTRLYHLPLRKNQIFYRMGWPRDRFGWVVEAFDRQHARRLQQTDLLKLNQEDPWWLKSLGGYPSHYFTLGYDVLGIYRKPTANGTTVELRCVCIPAWYTSDTDPIHLRDQYQRAAVYYAVSEYYASRGDARRAGDYLQQYLETAQIQRVHPEQAERRWQLAMDAKRWVR